MCASLRLVHAQLRRLVIVAGAALLFAVPSGAADWPRYGGGDLATNHVPAAAAAGLSSETVGDIVTRWSVNVGGRFVASPLYAENVPFGNEARGRDLRRHERGHRGGAPRRRRQRAVEAAGERGDAHPRLQHHVRDLVDARCSTAPARRLYTIGSDGLLHALSLATGEEAARLAAAHRRAHRRRVRLGRPTAAREPPLRTRRELLRQARPGRLRRRRPARGRGRRRPSDRRRARCHRGAEQHGRASGATRA